MTEQEFQRKIMIQNARKYLANDDEELKKILFALLDDPYVDIPDGQDFVYLTSIELPEKYPELLVPDRLQHMGFDEFIEEVEHIPHDLYSISKAKFVSEQQVNGTEEAVAIYRDLETDGLFALDATWVDQVYTDGELIPLPWSPYARDYHFVTLED
jgi:hypothetical protein